MKEKNKIVGTEVQKRVKEETIATNIELLEMEYNVEVMIDGGKENKDYVENAKKQAKGDNMITQERELLKSIKNGTRVNEEIIDSLKQQIYYRVENGISRMEISKITFYNKEVKEHFKERGYKFEIEELVFNVLVSNYRYYISWKELIE